MKFALISVYNKEGIIDFARQLARLGWQIISTNKTAKVLKSAGLKIIPIEKITGYKEVFGGRVKTISFEIASGLLYDRKNKEHLKEAKKLRIPSIDMVICNFYPFEKTIKSKKHSLKRAIENIDIGGVLMVRAGAKNYKYVTVIVDPKDYKLILEILKKKNKIPEKVRFQLAQKVFKETANYDRKISQYLKAKA